MRRIKPAETGTTTMHIRFPHTAIILIGFSAALRASAQSPSVTINERIVADYGQENKDVVEPALAMTLRARAAATHHVQFTGSPIALSRGVTGSNQSSTWLAQSIPGNYQGADSSVAVVDESTNTFVVFAMNAPDNNGSIRYTTFSPVSGFATSWTTAYSDQLTPNGGGGNDKPWVVRRNPSDFLMFFWRGAQFSYLRTTNGADWFTDTTGGWPTLRDVATTSPDDAVTAYFCCQPAIGADERVFLAYSTDAFGSTTQGGKQRANPRPRRR